MSDIQTPTQTQTPVKEIRKKSAKELIESNLEDLTTEELERRIAYIKAQKEEAELQDTRDRLDDRQNKRMMTRERFESRGRELRKTANDQRQVQAACRHQKAGRGDAPGGLSRGTDSNHCLLKHQLLTGEWWIRCMRCGKTWKTPHREYFPVGAEGDASFEQARADYKWAFDANTDNSPSSSILYQWESSDGNVSAKKFLVEQMKDVDLR